MQEVLTNSLVFMYSLSNESVPQSGKTSLTQPFSAPPSLNAKVLGVTRDIADTPKKWFLLRVSYGREHKAGKLLEELGMEIFLPIGSRIRIIGGKKKRTTESLIPNFLFVHSTEENLRDIIGRSPFDYVHYYYVPALDAIGNPIGRKGIKPLVIPDDQMEQFILWNTASDENKFFLPLSSTNKLKEGELVRVIKGKFAGITGFVCRFRQQTRVGVRIEGLGTVVTAYIPGAFLEKVEE